VYIYHFSCFSIFLLIFNYLKSVILIFCDFQFSRHISGPTVCIYHFSRFSVISLFFKSSSVCFSFSMIFSFLAIFHVLQWTFLIFQLFQFSSPYFTSYCLTCFLETGQEERNKLESSGAKALSLTSSGPREQEREWRNPVPFKENYPPPRTCPS
jgi:hypothetical protein